MAKKKKSNELINRYAIQIPFLDYISGLWYLYSVLQLFLKSDVVHLHESEAHHCNATSRARIEYCVLAPGNKQCRSS
jgi:hypothetical protein